MSVAILMSMSSSWNSQFFLDTWLDGKRTTFANRHGHMFQIGKGVRQGCILSPCLFNFYAEYIMQNAGVDVAQTGIKIDGRNIDNLKYSSNSFWCFSPLWGLVLL